MNFAIVAFLVLFIILGIPVAVAMGLASVLGLEFFTRLPMIVVAQRMFAGLDRFVLIAVPLFILAGNLMSAGGISRRLVDFATALVGGVKGGLACSCVVTCMIFASVSGSSVATTYAIGAILIPAMIANNYPKPMAAAVQASSAELGVLIPPSIPLILYGVATDTSIGQLFIAGIGPGLLVAFGLISFLLVYCWWKDLGQDKVSERVPLLRAFLRALPALVMPFVVLGGIYTGVFTPTEASAVAVVYALIVGWFVYRELTFDRALQALRTATVATAVVMLIIATASIFAFLVTRTGLPSMVSDWAQQAFTSKFTFLLAVNVMLFLIGTIIDPGPAILVIGPILAPVAYSYGIDPVHFGIIMVFNLAIGMITPPIGVNLFATCHVARLPIEKIAPALIPFILVLIVCLMIVTYVPFISIGLRDLLY